MLKTNCVSPRSLTLALSIAASLAVSSSVNAQPIAYEGFDYTPGTSLGDGLNGGGGWGGSWSVASGSQYGTNFAGTLTYSGVDTTGGHVQYGVASDLSQGNPGTVATQRALQNTFGSYGSTIWIGVLWQSLTDSTQGLLGYRETKIGLFSGAGVTSGVSLRNGTERVAIGIPHTYTVGLVDEYSIYLGGTQQASGVDTLRGTDPANTVFLLLRADMDGTVATDTLSMWVNPDVSLGAGGLGAAQAQWIITDLDIINAIRLQVASSNASGINGQILVDEIRIGTTFNDAVVGVPEPGIIAMFGIGLSGMFLMLRRKRN